MLILCLCPEFCHAKLIPGYAAAFRRRGIDFFCVKETLPFDSQLEDILHLCPERPSWIFHFESGLPLLPQGLERSDIPTVCFHADTYAFTHKRIRWSYLFDHVAVFHPSYDKLFESAGHPSAFLLPFAVRRDFFDGPELQRDFELGWVGQTSGHIYSRRAKWLPRFAAEFRTNDFSRQYSLEEVADVYRRSRIVVNIGRDDYPQDANLRVFEVLASGSLLITSLPSELTDLGFQEGTHFIGYHHEDEVIPLVHRFLGDEPNRARIAKAARSKVLAEHTYDHRAVQLLAYLGQARGNKLAPARAWPESRARLAALDFFASHALLDCAAVQFRHIVGHGFRETVEAAVLMIKAWIKYRCLLGNSPA